MHCFGRSIIMYCYVLVKIQAILSKLLSTTLAAVVQCLKISPDIAKRMLLKNNNRITCSYRDKATIMP